MLGKCGVIAGHESVKSNLSLFGVVSFLHPHIFFCRSFRACVLVGCLPGAARAWVKCPPKDAAPSGRQKILFPEECITVKL